MHPQLNLAIGTAGYYLVRKQEWKDRKAGDTLFIRNIGGRFSDYYSGKGEFFTRFFQEDGLVLVLDKIKKELTFQRMPASEVISGNASADYLWLQEDSNKNLVLFGSSGEISFWDLSREQEI